MRPRPGALARAARTLFLCALPFTSGLRAEEVGLPARTLSDLQWSEDGASLVGLADRGSRGAFFQAYDGATGRPIWRLALESLRDPLRGRKLAIDRWAPSTLAGELLLESDGDLFLARATGSPTLRQLTRTKGDEREARLSPDGRRVAFVRDADLWAIELEDGREKRLTDDGRAPAVVNGARAEPPFEPFAHGAAFAWAPDGRTLAFLRRDATGVRLRLASTITPGVLEVETGAPAEGRIEEVTWRFDALALAVERSSADGARLDLLLCHPQKLYCRKLSERATSAAPHRPRDFWFLPSGFVWGSRAPKRGDLAFFDTVGRERQSLLTGGWEPERLEAVDEVTGTLLLRASRAHAGRGAETGLLRLSVAPEVPPQLLAAGEEVELLVSPSTRSFVYGRYDGGKRRQRELRGVDGKPIAALPPPPTER